ncbi:class I SAM-dependent methyltransferase [Thermomonas sp.]|uniref:class I SAM-dependent methyltransferase n=1 Tax=Thermomonas sp. TaxID=1971895 RepID=UPI0035B32B0B
MTGLYVLWNRVFLAGLSVLEAVHSGVWLGLLRRRQLNAVTARYYRDQACYVDAGFNGSGLFDWEALAVSRYFPSNGHVLVAGCGGGRELNALAATGLRTTGFDPDDRLVETAQSTDWSGVAHVPVVLHALPDTVPGGLGVHDACLLGWTAYAHLAGRDARIAFLRGLAASLLPGAPLILSFWARPASVRQMRISHRVASLVAVATFNARMPEYGDWLGRHFIHYFDETAIRGELREAGFDLVVYLEQPSAHAVATRA